MCSEGKGGIKSIIILDMKNYVYEIIDGRRRRVSVFDFNEKGEITSIKPRAIRKVISTPEGN